MQTRLTHLLRSSITWSLLAAVPLIGCGDGDGPRVFIESPPAGATFSAASDADPAMAGIQIDVSVLVEKEQEGAEVWLYTNAGALADDPEAEPTLVETLPETGRVMFRPTLEPGTHELLACVRDCAFRSTQVRVTVTEGCAGIAFLDPAPSDGDVTLLGPDDDIDGDACGTEFTTDVRVSTSAPEGTSFQLFVNGTPSTTAEATAGTLTFPNVVMVPGNNTLAVQATLPTAESCMASYPTGLEVDCDGTGCMITTPEPGRSILNQDDDVSAADGFQADFEVTAGDDAIGETFNLIVDGEILTAESTGVGGSAVARYNAIDLSEGRHSVVAECFDTAGNETRTSPAEWIVDTVGCDISVAEPTADTLFIDEDDLDTSTDGIQISTVGTVSGDGCEMVEAGVCDSTLDPLDLSGLDFFGTATLATSAMQELCVVVTDDAGNETETRVPVRVRTDGPQLEIVTPSGPTAYNIEGTDGAVADLDPSTDACNAEFVVNCTEVGEDVELMLSGSTTPLATASCDAMGGLPSPYAGQATFPSAGLPSFDSGVSVNIVARQTADRLVGVSTPREVTADCRAPDLQVLFPMCGSVLRPSVDDTDGSTAGLQADVGIVNMPTNNADETTVTVTTAGGTPVSMASSSFRTGETIRIDDVDFGSGGELVLVACASDQAGNTGCTMDCSVTVGELPTVSITSPVADVPLNAGDDCDGGAGGLQVQVAATTDAADGSTARVIFGSNPAVTTTVAGGAVSACVDAVEGAMVPVRVEVDGADGTGVATVMVDVDSMAPTDAITDLSVESVVDRRGGIVRMSWTAVADAGGGSLQETEIRCATSAIDSEAAWDAADVRLSLTPSGTPTSVLAEDVGDFLVGIEYQCAVRGIDLGGVPTPLAPAVTVQLDFMQTIIEGPIAEVGQRVAPIGDIDNDLIEDFAITAAGEVYIFFGRTTPGAMESPDLSITGTPDIGGDIALGNVESIGDFNQDGLADFVVAARQAGSVYVFFGRADRAAWGTAPIVVSDAVCSTNVLCIRAEDSGSAFGSVVRAVGDFDGDGTVDLGIGAPFAETTFTGRAYIIKGSDTFGAEADVNVTTLDGFRIASTAAPMQQLVGRSIAAFDDLTSDGRADIFVSGNGSSATSISGKVRRINGRAHVGPGLDPIEWDTLPLTASGSNGTYASLIVSLGDIDGGGSPDLGVTAGGAQGRFEVLTGESAFSTGFSFSNDLASSGSDIYGSSVGIGLHPHLQALGQIDEAGSPLEVVIGTQQTSGGPGDIRLFYGPSTGTRPRSAADVILGPQLEAGEDSRDARAAFVGDINADGHMDIAMGQPLFPTGLAGAAGRVILFY